LNICGNKIKLFALRKEIFFFIFSCKNYLLKHVMERKIERRIGVTGRRERRSKQLLDYLKGKNDTGN